MAAPVFIDSQTQDAAAAQSLTFDMGTITHTTDDFLIAFVKQSENTGQQTWDDDGGGGNGWTREAYNRTTGGRDQETAVYWKFATSGAEPNPTFTWNTGGVNEPMSGSVLVYRGVDTATPFTGLTFLTAQNDANPPNPSVQIANVNSRVVVFHAATHDDISAVAAPTGFALRTQVWSGTANDHRNHFTADLEVDTIGTYTPPDWQHTVLNTTPEYHTYSIALNEIQPIGILTAPSASTNTATGLTITGFGFEAVQGTGTVELWSDLAGTTQIAQTVTSWADGSITFDLAAGALSDSNAYFVVTNDNGDVTSASFVVVGFASYNPQLSIGFDHYWTFQQNLDDTGIQANRDGIQIGAGITYSTNAIRSATHSARFSAGTSRVEIADSAFTNITTQHEARNIGGWVYVDQYQQLPALIWEEGGGVNNIYFILGFGNILLGNIADSSKGFKIQAYSDQPLLPGRWYHIMVAFSGNFDDDEFIMFVDGVQTTNTNGNPVGDGEMSTHSGDFGWGDADSSLDTGGTDIPYDSSTVMDVAHWGTASKVGGAALLAPAIIRQSLFEDGAPQSITLASDTAANMQTAIEAFDNTTHDELSGMTYQIGDPSDTTNMTLTITNQVIPDSVSCHIRWLGSGTLTIRNVGTSNASIVSTPTGGTVQFVNVVDVDLTAVELLNGNMPVDNAMVRILTDTGGPIAAGTELLRAFTNASGQVSFTFDYTGDQPVVARTRHGTTAPFLKSTTSLGTITVDGLSLTASMLPDE